MSGPTFSGTELPGQVLRGYFAEDPELAVPTFHPPGLNGELEIPNGLAGRRIFVPMLVYHANFTTYAKLAAYLRQLEQKKAAAVEGALVVPIPEGNDVYDNCRFDGFKINRELGILPASGTISSWFCEGLYVFKQNAVVSG